MIQAFAHTLQGCMQLDFTSLGPIARDKEGVMHSDSKKETHYVFTTHKILRYETFGCKTCLFSEIIMNRIC